MRQLSEDTAFQTADDKIAELEAQALKALEGGSEETSQEPTNQEQTEQADTQPSEEQQPEEQEASASESDHDTQDEKDNKEEKADLSKRGQDRMQQLANEKNSLRQEADKVPELEKEVKRLRALLGVGTDNQGRTSNQSTSPLKNESNLPWKQDENRELTPEELTAIIDQRASQKVTNQRILDTLNYDIATIEDVYPELRAPTADNPNPDFDEKLTDNISRWYQTLFKEDSSLRFSDFVNSIMSLKAKGEEIGRKQAQQKASEVLKQQAAEQAIDTTISPAEQTDAALENKIRSARSSKDLAEIEALLPHA